MSWHRNDPRQMTTLILREDGSSLVRAAGATDAELDLMIAAPEMWEALKAMVSSYDGIRDILTCANVIEKLRVADAVLAKVGL